LADLDGDGHDELLSGSFRNRVYVWPGRADAATAFGPRRDLVNFTGRPAFRQPHVASHACDWDGDGDADLVVGARRGEVFLLRNEGSPEKASFAAPVPLRAGDAPIKLAHGDAGPHAADWDGDGDHDLLVGDDRGGVTLYENTGTPAAPRLAKGRTLLPAKGLRFAGKRCRGNETCAMRAKPWVADWNGDGRPDLLVGDFHDHRTPEAMGNEHMHGWVWLYRRRPRPAAKQGGKAAAEPERAPPRPRDR